MNNPFYNQMDRLNVSLVNVILPFRNRGWKWILVGTMAPLYGTPHYTFAVEHVVAVSCIIEIDRWTSPLRIDLRIDINCSSIFKRLNFSLLSSFLQNQIYKISLTLCHEEIQHNLIKRINHSFFLPYTKLSITQYLIKFWLELLKIRQNFIEFISSSKIKYHGLPFLFSIIKRFHSTNISSIDFSQ